jgi:hypothetical protein
MFDDVGKVIVFIIVLVAIAAFGFGVIAHAVIHALTGM